MAKAQKQMKRKFLLLTLLIGGFLLPLEHSTATAQRQLFEAYYNYLGNYPKGAETDWSWEAQGLAHDDDHWFITQRWRLWKIPVTQDLKSVSAGGEVLSKWLYKPPFYAPGDLPELYSEGYNHLGDPCYYEFGGQGYVLVPVEGDAQPAIAIFRAKDLEYVIHAYLPGQSHAAWCAVDPQGNLYSSNEDITAIRKYRPQWNTLLNSNTPRSLDGPTFINLLDEAGSTVTLRAMQGGEISPSGELLYLVADGIHVFELSTGKRIQRSTNGYGQFNYEFGNCCFEEPEGITIWDLDDGRAPNIRGQLHVLMLDNDADKDDIYMKHYTHTLYVDRSYTSEERGTPSKPFKTVIKANEVINELAWDGAMIRITGGSYPERLTFSRRIKVLAERGSATVGK
jgi:hypothetical protein